MPPKAAMCGVLPWSAIASSSAYDSMKKNSVDAFLFCASVYISVRPFSLAFTPATISAPAALNSSSFPSCTVSFAITEIIVVLPLRAVVVGRIVRDRYDVRSRRDGAIRTNVLVYYRPCPTTRPARNHLPGSALAARRTLLTARTPPRSKPPRASVNRGAPPPRCIQRRRRRQRGQRGPGQQRRTATGSRCRTTRASCSNAAISRRTRMATSRRRRNNSSGALRTTSPRQKLLRSARRHRKRRREVRGAVLRPDDVAALPAELADPRQRRTRHAATRGLLRAARRRLHGGHLRDR